MRWHLVSPDGAIVRTADAWELAEARFRLRPILPHHTVMSDAALSMGSKPVVQPVVRAGRGGWYANCTTAAQRAAKFEQVRAAIMKGIKNRTPEAEAHRIEKLRTIGKVNYRKRQDTHRQAMILAGIERRKAKREATA